MFVEELKNLLKDTGAQVRKTNFVADIDPFFLSPTKILLKLETFNSEDDIVKKLSGKKILANVPSLGYLLGDEGSGTYLGKLLVRDILIGDADPEIRSNLKSLFAICVSAEILLGSLIFGTNFSSIHANTVAGLLNN